MSGYIGKPIGLEKLTWFPLLTDPEGGETTYGPAVKLARAMKMTVTPEIANAILESDDSVEDDLSLTTGFGLAMDASQLLNSIRAQVFGHELDNKGGLLFKKTDMPTTGALAFRSLLSTEGGSGTKYIYVVLYKVRLREFTENFETLKKGGITFQTHAGIQGTAMPRTSDGAIRYQVREDDENFEAATVANWFTAPAEKADGA